MPHSASDALVLNLETVFRHGHPAGLAGQCAQRFGLFSTVDNVLYSDCHMLRLDGFGYFLSFIHSLACNKMMFAQAGCR